MIHSPRSLVYATEYSPSRLNTVADASRSCGSADPDVVRTRYVPCATPKPSRKPSTGVTPPPATNCGSAGGRDVEIILRLRAGVPSVIPARASHRLPDVLNIAPSGYPPESSWT